MKALILDHHFMQDIDALVCVASPDDIIRIVPAELFASIARTVFPTDVFDADLARYHAAEFARHRALYRKLARAVISELYLTFPFDVLILPSDTFFYIRDVMDAAREMGIPTVVVQKESGVSAKSLEHHATEMRRWFPFIGDVMTVCSEKSKEFWVACGARPEQVVVVGQPRFDVYCSGVDAADLTIWGVNLAADRPIVLFLSYDLDAYAEERSLGSAHRPWAQLHDETESVLLDLAAKGVITLVVKPHPQQNGSQLAQLSARLTDVPNTYVLPTSVDTRSILLSADTVVGFQTTAIAEAMIAGKRVIYTFWTDAVKRVQALLLPFHEMDGAIEVAVSSEDLRERLSRSCPVLSDETKALRRDYCEPYVGIVDGRSAARVWELVGSVANRYRSTTALTAADEKALSYCRYEASHARRRGIAWRMVSRGMSLVPGAANLTNRARQRREREVERAIECNELITGTYRKTAVLRGPRRDGIVRAARRFAMDGIRASSGLDQELPRSRPPRPC